MTPSEAKKQLKKTMELVYLMRHDIKLTDAGRSYYNGFYSALDFASNIVSAISNED